METTTPLRLLIVEDNPDDAELVFLQFAESGRRTEWQRVEDEAGYLAALEKSPDVILSDWNLPRFSGRRALQLLRERGLDTPFIIVSGQIGEEAAVEALKEGADDYLLKDRLSRLGASVERALQDRALRREQRRAEERYRTLFENIPVGLYRSTPDGQILEANAALVEILGYPDRETLLARNAVEVYADPADRRRLVATLEEGVARNFEVRLRRYDGTVFWGSISIRIVHEADGSTFYEGAITDITARRQAEEEIRQRNRELGTLLDISRRLGALLDLDALLRAVVTALVEVVPGAEAASLWLHDGRGRLVVRAWAGYADEDMRGLALPDDAGLVGLIYQSRQGRIIEDVTGEPAFVALKSPHLNRIRATLAAPLLLASGPIGVIFVDNLSQVTAFPPESLRLLESLAGQVAVALERSRLYEETRRRAACQEALSTIIAAAFAAQDLPGLLATALDCLLQALGLEAGGLWVSGRYIVRGFPAQEAPAIRQAMQSIGKHVSVPRSVDDWHQVAPSDALSAMAPLMAQLGVRATLTVPVLAEGQPLGGLTVAAREPRLWTAEEVALAEAVGRQLGMAAERLRLLEQSHEQARRLQQIMDAVTDGLLLLDAKGRVLRANPAGRRYLALLAGVQEGQTLTHLGPRPLAEVLRPLPPGQWHEVVVEGPPRQTFQVQAQALEIEPQVKGWVLDIYDATHERELAARMEQQSRLAAMGQFAAGIAHDFNNVLQGILSFAELLERRTELSAQAREQAHFICRMADRGAQMTRQILDFSRQSASEKRPLEMGAFLREMVGLFRRTVPERIELLLECAPGEHPVHGDEAQLQQVLMNLVANARDAMPQGGRLTLRLKSLKVGPGDRLPYAEVPPGDWVCLEVADTGCGIPAEALPHIFEPFFTTKEPGHGTGLGLPQAYGIVQQHEGYIHVQSAVGQGTTVSVLLPARREREEKPSPQRPAAPAVGGEGGAVLLVEDEPAVRQALAAMVADMGYGVLVAASGPEALEVYGRQGKEIALVLTDAVMPGLELPNLLRSLREQDPAVRVVVMSGSPQKASIQDLQAQGMALWLNKPVSRERLAQVLQQLLGRQDRG